VLALLGIGALVFVGLAVLGVLAAVATFVGWIISIPFVLLGWMFRLLVGLLALPFLLVMALVVGFVPAILLAVGLTFFVVPVLPFVAVIGLTIWVLRRNRRQAPATAS
jgi:hypothetical protein